MPYETIVSGTVITAAWANANVRDQVVTPFASDAARTAAVTAPMDGQATYLEDTNDLAVWDAGVAQHVPVGNTGGWTVFNTGLISCTGYSQGSTAYAGRYRLINKTVTYAFRININTGGGFAPGGGVWAITLPVTAQSDLLPTGSVYINDSGSTLRAGTLIITNATHVIAVMPGDGSPIDSNGPTHNFAGDPWTTGDAIQGSITYEAA